jgi:hypothetical protein
MSFEALPGIAEAIDKVATFVPVISEDVHVPGYGMVSMDRAKKEADLAHTVAKEHADKGNHSGAAYQHERAAMFHRAIYNHLENQNPSSESAQVSPSPQRSDLNALESTAVVEEKKDPAEGRVASKFKRALARKYKNKDKEKKERQFND